MALPPCPCPGGHCSPALREGCSACGCLPGHAPCSPPLPVASLHQETSGSFLGWEGSSRAAPSLSLSCHCPWGHPQGWNTSPLPTHSHLLVPQVLAVSLAGASSGRQGTCGQEAWEQQGGVPEGSPGLEAQGLACTVAASLLQPPCPLVSRVHWCGCPCVPFPDPVPTPDSPRPLSVCIALPVPAAAAGPRPRMCLGQSRTRLGWGSGLQAAAGSSGTIVASLPRSLGRTGNGPGWVGALTAPGHSGCHPAPLLL